MIDWLFENIWVPILILVVGLAFFLYAAIEDERRWQEFVHVNDCVKIARRSNPDTLVLINNFPHYIPQPDTVTWRCADGQEYMR